MVIPSFQKVAAGDPLFTYDSPDAEKKVREAKTNIEGYQKQLNAAYKDIAKLNLTAPYAGKLLETVKLTVGDEVGAQKVATLVDDTRMRLTQYYSYAYQSELYAGQTVQVSVPALMSSIDGRVEKVHMVKRVTSEGSELFSVEIVVPNAGVLAKDIQVLNNGISKSVFYAYVKERGLEQAAHGVYVSPDTWTDAMYLLHLRCGQAVFSHETALFFHDLTDREPLKYTITVRTGYNPSRLQEDGFQVYTVKKDLHEIGIIAMQTSFGHSVPVYDMERTICDLLRSRKNVEMQVFQDALKQYAKRKDKNLRMLMKYAAMFHVEKILRPYLEVLL